MAVTFDAAGAGYNAGGASGSWAHTISGNAVLVGVACSANPPTVKVGTTSMTSLGTPINLGGSFNYFIFGLLNPPTGAQTIAVTNGSLFTNGDSVSYSGVGSIGTYATTSGSGTTISQTVSSASGQMVFHVCGKNLDGTFGAYNQTQRYSGGTPGNSPPLLMGDAPGAGSVSFTVTISSTSWMSLAALLIPSPIPNRCLLVGQAVNRASRY
jgi:hypothetical protein